MDLDKSNVLVIVFVMDGCGACEDYLPVFNRVAKQYADVPVLVYDISKDTPAIQQLAERFKVHATPTTVVAKRGPGHMKIEGALEEHEVTDLMQTARRVQRRR